MSVVPNKDATTCSKAQTYCDAEVTRQALTLKPMASTAYFLATVTFLFPRCSLAYLTGWETRKQN